MTVTLFAKSLCMEQALYINRNEIVRGVKREAPGQVYRLPDEILRQGKNIFAAVGPPLQKRHRWEELNTNPGIIQIVTPEPVWKRSVFNGLAQVIVQSTRESGTIVLKATGDELNTGKIQILTNTVLCRPTTEENQ